jgi:thermitase
MKIMDSRKIILLPLILGLFVSSFSYQKLRVDMERKKEAIILKRQIRNFQENWIRRERGQRYAPGQVLVKFKPSFRPQLIEATLAAYETELIRKIRGLEVYQIKIPAHTSVEEMVYALNRNPDVEYAEPNYRTRLAVTPNDSLFDYQYYLHNSGQEIGPPGSPRGKSEADIKATAAWEETKGSSDVLIAIVDTGVDLLHPDLKNKIYSGGRDFINDDFDATDDYGHGTIVASIATAETNNREGIAGVAWNSKILPVKVMDENGEGYYSELIDGIMWAVDNGASVINLSLGGDEASDPLCNALKHAYDNGVIVVAAVGNDAASVLYPAAYDAYCLAVAATDYEDKRTEWSNFGTQVDVAAPGDRVVGAVPTWYWGPDSFPYAFGTGTSVSTPQVSGLAALIKGLKPWLTVGQIMDVIRYSADDVNSSEHPGQDDYIGFGRINMEKALVPIKIKK